MLQQSAMKLIVLPAESSRRLRWRRRSLWRQVLFLFSGRQASGLQQISGAVCWPRMRPARSRRPDTLSPTHSGICTQSFIGAMVIVWRVRGKTIRSVLCNIVCNIVHSAMHTYMNRITVLWIGFCLTGPISLCLDSFLPRDAMLARY